MLLKILSKTQDLFFNYGVKSITMDDLAKEMGVSKKTLYRYVDNKADLVNKTLQSHLEAEKKSLAKISEDAGNAIEEMFGLGKHFMQHLKTLNPSVVYDLQKYYPETWQMFLDYKNTFIYSMIYQNIKKGIAQGIYREDIDADIISRIYSGRSEVLIDQNIFPSSKYIIRNVYLEYLKYHIRGIASPKGLKYLEKQKLE